MQQVLLPVKDAQVDEDRLLSEDIPPAHRTSLNNDEDNIVMKVEDNSEPLIDQAKNVKIAKATSSTERINGSSVPSIGEDRDVTMKSNLTHYH